MRSNLRALFTAVTLAFLASFTPGLAADVEIDGWKLVQSGRETGFLDVYLCKTAVRMFVPKSGLSILASAPWKEACWYCTKTGKVFKTPVTKFRNPYIGAMALFDGGTLADIDVIQKGPSKAIGIACTSYEERPGFAQRQLAKHRNGLVANRAPMHLQYMVTDQFKVDPQVGHLMSKFYALPVVPGVPLQFTYTDVTLDQSKQLTTTSCKTQKFKSSEFKLPPGLKEVNDGMKVLTPDNADDGLDLMMMGRTKLK